MEVICYLQADTRYTRLVTADCEALIQIPLKELLDDQAKLEREYMSAVQAKPPFMRDWLQAHSMRREEAPVEILSERHHRLICLLAADISRHDDPEIALWLQHDVSDVYSVRAADS